MARKYNALGKRPSRFVDWDQYDHLLGSITDQELADLIGCSDVGVRDRRLKLGITPLHKTHWTAEEEAEYLTLHEQGARRCGRCKQIKPHGEYHKNGSKSKNGRDGLNRWCKSCKSAYQAASIEVRRRYWLDLAGAYCHHCGWDLYPACLDFHHVNGDDKDWSPGKLIMSRPIGSSDVYAELDKCAVLCCNCHQAIHRDALSLEFQKCDGLGWTPVKFNST